MAEKKTVMVLKVDLQCPCCYKKIQKILCRIPQISDRVFDQKANTVTIVVICCSPLKIRDKLLCKGGKIIKSIEIIEPPKPKPAPKPDAPKPDAPKPKPAEQKPKAAEKPKETEKPKAAEKPKPEEAAKPKSNGKGNAPPPAAAAKPKDAPKPEPPKNPAPAPAPAPAPPAPAPGAIPVGLPPVHPSNPCCGPCYEGYGGGPCYQGYGFPPPPPQPCYDGNYGPGYVYGKPCYVTRCDYFSEENSTGCTIM